MSKLPYKFRNDPSVFCISTCLIVIYYFLDARILRTRSFIYGNRLPGIAVDAVIVCIDHNIKAPDLICTSACLYDRYAVDNGRFFNEGMRMSADYHINSPRRVKHCSELLVFFKTYMCQEHCKINIQSIICITDPSNFFSCILQCYKSSYHLIHLALHEGYLCDDSYEKNLHPVDFYDLTGFEESCIIGFDMEIGIDYGELGAFFQEKKM